MLCSATPCFLLNRLRASPESQRSVHELIPFLTARNVRLPVCRTMLNLLFILAGLSLATSSAQSKWRNLQRMFPAFLPPGSSSAGQVWESGQSQFPGPQSRGWALAVFGGWLHRGQMPLPSLNRTPKNEHCMGVGKKREYGWGWSYTLPHLGLRSTSPQISVDSGRVISLSL